jgi:hypothetical protein
MRQKLPFAHRKSRTAPFPVSKQANFSHWKSLPKVSPFTWLFYTFYQAKKFNRRSDACNRPPQLGLRKLDSQGTKR